MSNDHHCGYPHVEANATVTLFFKSNEEFAVFKEHIGCTPLLFMCLAGNLGTDKKVNVSTLKDQSWWEKASGTKCDMMKEQAGMLCDASTARADVAQLVTFQPLGGPACGWLCRSGLRTSVDVFLIEPQLEWLLFVVLALADVVHSCTAPQSSRHLQYCIIRMPSDHFTL